jgi:hypothetical protein
MKAPAKFILALGFVILALALVLFTDSRRVQKSVTALDATVNRDCAPWDGAAFTVSIPYDQGSTITISIWRAPDFDLPTTYTFPDETGQVGQAYILWELDPLMPLHGEVSFQRVREGQPVEGRFSLTSEGGEQFQGSFVAAWEGRTVFCGL